MDEDLFAVFDDNSDKPEEIITSELKTEKFDAYSLISSIIGSNCDYESNESKTYGAYENQIVGVKREICKVENSESNNLNESKKLKLENGIFAEAASENENKLTDQTEIESDLQTTLSLVEAAPRITVHTLNTVESCVHEVAVPPGHVYEPLHQLHGERAKDYQFTLDPFQEEAILCIGNNQSVLVSAHTSAGKTVTAEYAIAQSLKLKQRVIYTTPIKALSNQKYREFYEEFNDVGLVTGDVTINPSASCLIMTTEILRSMLYRGSEIMREVAWVIFDEIHYMRDKERGVVWEETIILLPDNVHYVFLSATIPNARQFAEWIAHLHKQPCHVVYTEYRPTPLQHYIFPQGGDGIHLVVDEHGKFREDNFAKAMETLGGGPTPEEEIANGGKNKKGGSKKTDSSSSCFKIVKMIMERNFAPVIVFSFSKKECEAYALAMSKLDFNTPEEKKLVDEVFQNAMMVLNEEDRALPQVENVLPLLKRGIGIHHGGLLPILKETTEILFGEGLIKALFATETFAMGLNMPARTVLFTSSQKFDGHEMRFLSSGEYIQMSGRAGRRGLDDKGIVIQMMDEKISPAVGRNLLMGAADHLNSAFHLTYNMVLNLLRVEEINPEFMMERSFHQFQNYSNIPKLYQMVKNLEERVSSSIIKDEAEVASYYRLRDQLQNLGIEFHSWLVKPQYLVPFLQPGRLVSVKHGDKDFGYGAIVNWKKRTPKEKDNPMEHSETYTIDVLLHVTNETAKSQSTLDLMPAKNDPRNGIMEVVSIEPNLIQQISSVRIFIPQDIRPKENRKSVYKSIEQVEKRFKKEGIPLLDPVKDMKIKEKPFKEIIEKIAMFENRLEGHSLHNDPDINELLEDYSKKSQLIKDLESAKAEVKKAKSLLQMADLKCMKRVLRRMGYCTSTDVIEVKGRIACEVGSADEILLTEMVFNGLFTELDPSQTAAILSCFVCDEKTNDFPKLTEKLSGPLRKMNEMAKQIAKVSKDAKMNVDEEEYISRFKPYMMDVVHEWCKGASFSDLCKITDLFEGSIIRSMRRLEELLRQMVQAAKNIGNTELENKFSEAIKLLKRDIVFAASLYL